MRHDEVRDVFSELLAETCSNVTTEPELQPLDGVSLQTRDANRQDGAWLGIKAGGFWGRSRFEATFSMYGSSTHLRPPADQHLQTTSSQAMTARSDVCMKNGCARWKEPASRH